MRCLCFDIGGTSIKYAIIEDEKIEDIKSMETRKNEFDNHILEDVINVISSYNNIDVIGICTAGVVNSNTGEIVFAGPTIPNYTGTKIKKVLKKNLIYLVLWKMMLTVLLMVNIYIQNLHLLCFA